MDLVRCHTKDETYDNWTFPAQFKYTWFQELSGFSGDDLSYTITPCELYYS